MQDGALISSQAVSVDIRSWMPGTFMSKFTVQLPSSAGDYTILLGIKSPQTEKMDVKFANASSVTLSTGVWQQIGTISMKY